MGCGEFCVEFLEFDDDTQPENLFGFLSRLKGNEFLRFDCCDYLLFFGLVRVDKQGIGLRVWRNILLS